jgi:putative ABC transport system ATP-binding protein
MLELIKITKSFQKEVGVKKLVLANFALILNKGDFLVVIGNNGSGKSTILKCITGELKIDSGEIILDGSIIHNIPDYQRAKKISYVSQDISKSTISNLSILDNLRLAIMRNRCAKLSYNFSTTQVDYLRSRLAILKMGLESRLDDLTGSLSGGQRQALSLIMATLTKPNLLLLDEHCSALDPKAAHTVMQITESLIKEYKITAIMINHNVRDSIKYGNRLIMLSQGQISHEFNEREKSHLTSEELLELFHQEEDTLLLGE